MSAASEPVGTLEVALAHAMRLLATDPSKAAEQAGEVLKVAPGHPAAVLVLGPAQRAPGKAPSAIAILEPLTRKQPHWAAAHYELGIALSSAGQSEPAVVAAGQA